MTADSPPISTPLHTNNLAGIASMLICQALFVANDALVKLATASLPPTQIMALRGVVATALVATIAHRSGAIFKLKYYLNPRVILRSTLEALVAITYLIALPHIPLPTIITILQASPLLIVAASGVFFGERIGWQRWLAVLIGFVGVIVVVRPGGGGPLEYVWIALLTVAFMTVRDLITRHIHADIPSSIVTLMTTAFVGIGGFLGALVQPWKPVDLTNGLYLLSAAVLVAAANHMLIRSLRLGEIAVVTPFRYSAIVWATALGVAIWGDLPDAMTFAGTALIVAGGVYIFRHERRRRVSVADEVHPGEGE